MNLSNLSNLSNEERQAVEWYELAGWEFCGKAPVGDPMWIPGSLIFKKWGQTYADAMREDGT